MLLCQQNWRFLSNNMTLYKLIFDLFEKRAVEEIAVESSSFSQEDIL